MTRLEATEIIEARLGQRNGLAMGNRIIVELQAAQRHFEEGSKLPWFLKRRKSVTLSDGMWLDTVASGFLREVEDISFVWVFVGTQRIPLKKEDYELLVPTEDINATGLPEYYCLEPDISANDTRVRLFPMPDATYQGELVFYQRDALQTADETENAWLRYMPSLLIAQAGLQIARALRSPESVALFTSDLAEAHQTLHHSNIAHSMAARSMVMGG